MIVKVKEWQNHITTMKIRLGIEPNSAVEPVVGPSHSPNEALYVADDSIPAIELNHEGMEKDSSKQHQESTNSAVPTATTPAEPSTPPN